ncbi:uncharacterized protein [Tiliqua scincoides]|uniref:uncharacterized protein n=1 Tax=Tiliqua scincoides TaxID=71010 RepID=UPI003462D29F
MASILSKDLSLLLLLRWISVPPSASPPHRGSQQGLGSAPGGTGREAPPPPGPAGACRRARRFPRRLGCCRGKARGEAGRAVRTASRLALPSPGCPARFPRGDQGSAEQEEARGTEQPRQAAREATPEAPPPSARAGWQDGEVLVLQADNMEEP